MTEEELDNFVNFTLQSCRLLQKQINSLEDQITELNDTVKEIKSRSLRDLYSDSYYLSERMSELKARVYSLEEESRWNIFHGNIEQCPREDIVIRLADGRLSFNGRQEEVTDESDNTD